MNDSDNTEMLLELMKSNREQADYAKRAWIMSVISAVCVLVMATAVFVTLVYMAPRINTLLNEAQYSLTSIQKLTADLSTEIEEADISGRVGEIGDVVSDVNGLVEDVGVLVNDTQGNLEQTMEKINAIDLEGLNQSIRNLSEIIEPLAKFFNVFG